MLENTIPILLYILRLFHLQTPLEITQYPVHIHQYIQGSFRQNVPFADLNLQFQKNLLLNTLSMDVHKNVR